MSMPRKPEHLHRLTGTKSEATDEYGTVAPGRPKFPRDLTPESKQVFKELCGLLAERKHLTAADAELIRLFAITKVRHQKAVAHVDAEGELIEVEVTDKHGNIRTVLKKNSYLEIAFTCEKNLAALLDRLGMTAVSRHKVQPTQQPTAAELDPMAALFGKGRKDRQVFAAPSYDDTRPVCSPTVEFEDQPDFEA